MPHRFQSVFLALVLISCASMAQNFGGGVHVGLISSHILEMGVPASYNKVGFWGGGFTDYRFTPKSTLQLELAFVQKGTRQAGNLDNDNVDVGVNLNYLEMPIVYRWWGIRNMSVEIGPQLAVLLSHKEWDQFGDLQGPNLNYRSFERFELSAAAGLSYYLLRNRLEINARYSISAIPIRVRAQEGTAIWPVARQYNSVIGFSVRWWFKNTYETPPKKEKSVRSLE
jgi:hypothetical protein